ncbi:MAG: helix-turn-helix transcriptional regulator [Myxococcales bacterium]|nr:helix-turn-helix transcriptional regulator [Myxococcales bacterium]
MSAIGSKWTIPVVASLSHGALRFGALMRALDGISQRMLTLTLRSLERDGMLMRRVLDGNPAPVEYELTALGRSMLEPVSAFGQWVQEHAADIHAARSQYDQLRNPQEDSAP